MTHARNVSNVISVGPNFHAEDMMPIFAGKKSAKKSENTPRK